MYFRYFVIISPWKRVGLFIWTKLNSLHQRMHCAKFGWNWPSGSGEEDFFNFVNVFLLLRYYLPLEKGRALHLNKHITFTQECFVPSLVEIDSVVLEKRFLLNFINVFFLFRNYLPLEKAWLYLNKLESPSPKDAMCQVWLILVQWFWKRKCEKFPIMPTMTTTLKTNKVWSENFTEPFAQVS